MKSVVSSLDAILSGRETNGGDFVSKQSQAASQPFIQKILSELYADWPCSFRFWGYNGEEDRSFIPT